MTSVHLAILIHGLYGSPTNLVALRDELTAAHSSLQSSPRIPESSSSESPRPLELVVLRPKSFTGGRTYDGIDICAHRSAAEVDQEVRRLEGDGKRVVAVSVVRILSIPLSIADPEDGLFSRRVYVFSSPRAGMTLVMARYLIGLLESRSPSFFSLHRPACFSTAATPVRPVLLCRQKMLTA